MQAFKHGVGHNEFKSIYEKFLNLVYGKPFGIPAANCLEHCHTIFHIFPKKIVAAVAKISPG